MLAVGSQKMIWEEGWREGVRQKWRESKRDKGGLQHLIRENSGEAKTQTLNMVITTLRWPC